MGKTQKLRFYSGRRCVPRYFALPTTWREEALIERFGPAVLEALSSGPALAKLFGQVGDTRVTIVDRNVPCLLD